VAARESVEDAVAAFSEAGFVVVSGLLDDAFRSEALEAREKLRAHLRLAADAPIVAAAGDNSALAPFASSSQLVDLASALLATPVSCFGITFLSKAPGSGLPARWHQDAAPWRARLGGAPALTLWCALSPADRASGCLRAVPGTQALVAHELFPDTGEHSLFGVGMADDLVDESHAVDVPVSPGDVVGLHPNLIHGSWPNDGVTERIALAIRYSGTAI
jgi:hypothetical protein